EYLRTENVLDWEEIARISRYNSLGLQVFFPKLTEEERLQWLSFTLKRGWIDHDELQFCLSKLNQNLQAELLKNFPLQILETFLEWPALREFLDVAQILLPYLSLEQFRDLLRLILSEKIGLGSNDFNYIPLIRELWGKSPSGYKEFVKKDEIFCSLKLIIEHDPLQPFPPAVLMHNPESTSLEFRSSGTLFVFYKNAFKCEGLYSEVMDRYRRIDMTIFSEK
ncbi:uncharacterized protein NPIL_421831, partial [Nephila pilipes]